MNEEKDLEVDQNQRGMSFSGSESGSMNSLLRERRGSSGSKSAITEVMISC